MEIKKSDVIVKRNILNEIRANSMTLQELRFFSIYLSKINSKDPKTRVVTFPLSDFQAIMNLEKKNIAQMKATTNRLLCKIVNIPDEKGGYIGFQLFKRCRISRNDSNEWYMEIDAHDDALPLMFEFKERYFKYHLWNALRLQSANQLRMYEILKQYENVGHRIFAVDELKELLGIDKKDYPRFGDFRTNVLNVCQKALALHTDIKYDYEPCGKLGRGGKVLQLKFTIVKNRNYVNQMTMEIFLDKEKRDVEKQVEEPIYADVFVGQMTMDSFVDKQAELVNIDTDQDIPEYAKRIIFLMEACDNEFSYKEMRILYNEIQDIFPSTNKNDYEMACFKFILRKYMEMDRLNEKSPIKHRFSYFKKLIQEDK